MFGNVATVNQLAVSFLIPHRYSTRANSGYRMTSWAYQSKVYATMTKLMVLVFFGSEGLINTN
jgi:hypothetical protein